MKNDKYVAYYSADNAYETFLTFEKAEAWLKEKHKEDGTEGFSEETINGEDYIAEVTHRSKYKETDWKKDYENDEEWPYDSDWESVGEIVMEKISPIVTTIPQVKP